MIFFFPPMQAYGTSFGGKKLKFSPHMYFVILSKYFPLSYILEKELVKNDHICFNDNAHILLFGYSFVVLQINLHCTWGVPFNNRAIFFHYKKKLIRSACAITSQYTGQQIGCRLYFWSVGRNPTVRSPSFTRTN